MAIINGSDTVVSDVKSALNFTHEGLYGVFNFLFKQTVTVSNTVTMSW